MGCHTWFGKPLTKEEREKLRQSAKSTVQEYFEGEDISKSLYNVLIESIDKDTDIWIKGGWFKFDDYIYEVKGKFYIDLAHISGENCLFKPKEYFHDNFRVKNYPNWIIHNKRELRNKMRKKYFRLTERQLEDISRFFKEYPNGIIRFG